jgi:hypothetical protein
MMIGDNTSLAQTQTTQLGTIECSRVHLALVGCQGWFRWDIVGAGSLADDHIDSF